MTTPAAPTADLDPSVLAEIRALGTDGEDFLAEVTSLFLTDVPGQLSTLAAAIDSRDPETAWRIAHRLKGTALGIGAWRMANVCGTVESDARGRAFDWAAAHTVALFLEFESTRLALLQAVHA